MLASPDLDLLQFRYYQKGSVLFVCRGNSHPFPDSAIPQVVSTYQEKLTNLAISWGCNDCALVSNTKTIKLSNNMPNLHTGQLFLTPALTDLLKSWADAGVQDKLGLVRLPDESQLVVSSNTNDFIWDLDTATTKRREEYIEPADLQDLRRLTGQQDAFEFTFRSMHRRPGGLIAEFTNSYSLFDDGVNTYQISKRIGHRLITA